jgi:hypothetical protein
LVEKIWLIRHANGALLLSLLLLVRLATKPDEAATQQLARRWLLMMTSLHRHRPPAELLAARPPAGRVALPGGEFVSVRVWPMLHVSVQALALGPASHATSCAKNS